MYDAGGRGNNDGGDRGGEICLWSREMGGSLHIGEGNNPVVDGIIGECIRFVVPEYGWRRLLFCFILGLEQCLFFCCAQHTFVDQVVWD